jgi:hypothetical protein
MFLFADTVYIFADDFPELSDVVDFLAGCMDMRSASTLPLPIRPRVIVVLSDDANDTPGSALQKDRFYSRLQEGHTGLFMDTFSSINLIHCDEAEESEESDSDYETDTTQPRKSRHRGHQNHSSRRRRQESDSSESDADSETSESSLDYRPRRSRRLKVANANKRRVGKKSERLAQKDRQIRMLQDRLEQLTTKEISDRSSKRSHRSRRAHGNKS